MRREPSLIVGFISAVISFVIGFGFDFLTATQGAAMVSVVTVLGAAANAAMVRPWQPAAFVAVVGPIAALAAAYGWNWSREAVAGLEAIIVAGLALWAVRPQVSPKV